MMLFKLKICFFFFVLNFLLYSQKIVIFKDANTNEKIDGVKVFDKKNQVLAVSDSTGITTIPEEIDKIKVEANGYKTTTLMTMSQSNIAFLEPIYEELEKITVSIKDPKALKIIRMAIKNRKQNHPNKLPSYFFTSYNKFKVDTNVDSLEIVENPRTKIDSSHNKMVLEWRRRVGFISERAIEHFYSKKYGAKNVVVSTKIAGLSQPIFEILAIQPIDFFMEGEKFKFFIVEFPNPVSNYGISEYLYQLRDSMEINGRLAYRIAFFPKKNSRSRLEGNIFIDKETFAIVKFKGNTKSEKAFLEMDWTLINGAWFPKQHDFMLKGDKMNVRPTINEGNKEIPSPTVTQWIYLSTTFSNHTTPFEAEKKLFVGYEDEVKSDVAEKWEERMHSYRPEALTMREKNAYPVIDSLAKEADIDRNMWFFDLFTRQRLKMGKIDYHIFDVLSFNDYEGLRLNAKISTNHTLSDRFFFTVYGAYGFRDRAFKGGASMEVIVNRPYNGRIIVEGRHDVAPAGRFTNPFLSSIESSLSNLSNVYYNKYYQSTQGTLGYSQDFFRNLSARFMVNYQEIKPLFDYGFSTDPVGKSYNIFTQETQIKWAPNAKYLRTPYGKVTLEDPYPYFLITGLQSASKPFEFTRWDISYLDEFNFLSGKLNPIISGGMLFGDAPLFYQFEGMGNARNRNNIGERIGLSARNAFETMVPGTFFVDRFVAVQLRHQLRPFKIGKKFRLPVSFVYRGMWGDMRNDNQLLHNTTFFFSQPDKFYQEAGIEFNSLVLRSLGLGAYYRFGAYNTGDFQQDFAIKITFTSLDFFSFGR